MPNKVSNNQLLATTPLFIDPCFLEFFALYKEIIPEAMNIRLEVRGVVKFSPHFDC